MFDHINAQCVISCVCWCVSDSPQVQCIQSYSSQEPDELSVEMADVLHILECTDDGEMTNISSPIRHLFKCTHFDYKYSQCSFVLPKNIHL